MEIKRKRVWQWLGLCTLLVMALFVGIGRAEVAKGAKLAAPKSLKVTGGNKLTIAISYSKVTGAKGYQIYRAGKAKGTFQLIQETTKPGYADKETVAGTKYYYKVRAYKMVGGKKKYSSYTAIKSASTARKFTHTSQIDGGEIEAYASSSVSRMLRTEQMGTWGNESAIYVPNMYYWSKKNAMISYKSTYNETTWTHAYEYSGSIAQVKYMVDKYVELLKQYDFACTDISDTLVMGYNIMREYRLEYTGSEKVSKNGIVWSYYDDTYTDAKIFIYQPSYADKISISFEMPKEITVKDTGERMDGTTEEVSHTEFAEYTSENSYFIKWGDDDSYTTYAFGNDEEYIDIKITTGTYETGDVFRYEDYKLGNHIQCTILSYDIVQHEISNYIDNERNYSMIKDFYVEVLERTDKVHALYYYIQCEGKTENFALEGIFVEDNSIEREAKLDFVSNGKTVKVKAGDVVVAKAGTTYKVKKGSSFTLVSPYSGDGYQSYMYTFYASKNGVISTGHNDLKNPKATLTAKKKGTVLYSVGFAGTYYTTELHSIKVPGMNKYNYYTTKILKADSKSKIIKIVITK